MQKIGLEPKLCSFSRVIEVAKLFFCSTLWLVRMYRLYRGMFTQLGRVIRVACPTAINTQVDLLSTYHYSAQTNDTLLYVTEHAKGPNWRFRLRSILGKKFLAAIQYLQQFTYLRVKF